MAANALRRLIALDGDCEQLVREAREYLRNIQASSQDSIAPLRLADLDWVLEQCAEGVLSGERIQEWAEILEMNEHIDYEPGVEEAIADVLFRLSTPEINKPISQAVARELRAALSAARSRRR
jgi:hypothetical protein